MASLDNNGKITSVAVCTWVEARKLPASVLWTENTETTSYIPIGARLVSLSLPALKVDLPTVEAAAHGYREVGPSAVSSVDSWDEGMFSSLIPSLSKELDHRTTPIFLKELHGLSLYPSVITSLSFLCPSVIDGDRNVPFSALEQMITCQA